MRRKNVVLIGFVLAVLAAFVLIVVLPGGKNESKNEVVTLGGPGADKIVLTPPAQAIVEDAQRDDKRPGSGPGDTESNLNAPPPPKAIVDASQDLQPKGQPEIPARVPLATASAPGCSTKLVRNYSSRRGAPVLLGMIHWTGSRPTLGSAASGLAIVSWFNQGAAQASSNRITDQDGRCWLVVPESQKAWTQAAFNPWSVSVEIVNQGVQPLFQRPAGRAAVVRIMRQWHASWKIPYRRGQVTQNGCRVVRSGFLAHRDLGSCGGGHPDVGSFNLDGLIREAARADNCNAKCRRTQDLRARNHATHAELKRRSCAPIDETKNARCLTLRRRDAAVHKAAAKAGVKL